VHGENPDYERIEAFWSVLFFQIPPLVGTISFNAILRAETGCGRRGVELIVKEETASDMGSIHLQGNLAALISSQSFRQLQDERYKGVDGYA
jgi:hypothetical protein